MRALITTDTVGGVWRFAQELVTGLLEAGDSVALVSFGRFPSPVQRAECTQLESMWGDAFSYFASDLPLEWMQNNEKCFDPGAVLISEVARQFKPDLVHANQFCWGAVEIGIPTVVTAHSDVFSWSRACRGGPPADSPWISRYRGMVQRGLEGADAVTAPTQWMMQALGEDFRLPRQQRAIANGRQIGSPACVVRRRQAVTAGRLWDEAKDVALLERVSTTMPLVVAGESHCEGVSMPRLTQARLLGSLSEKELLQVFQESAVYICTSRYEPFGLAPLEAALCGCAIVARKIPSLQEVWEDAALYFHDAEDLSDLLTWLDEDRDSLRKAQERALLRASRYTRGAMVTAYKAVYSMVTEMAGVS